MPTLEFDVRDWIVRYLVGEVSLPELHRFVVGASATIELDEKPPGTDLLHFVELRLAEFSNGHWSEDDLKRVLRSLVQRVPIQVPQVLVPRRVPSRKPVEITQIRPAKASA